MALIALVYVFFKNKPFFFFCFSFIFFFSLISLVSGSLIRIIRFVDLYSASSLTGDLTVDLIIIRKSSFDPPRFFSSDFLSFLSSSLAGLIADTLCRRLARSPFEILPVRSLLRRWSVGNVLGLSELKAFIPVIVGYQLQILI